MPQGILGFNRLSEVGPLTFNQEELQSYSADEIEDFIVEIIEEENVDPQNPSEEEKRVIIGKLAAQMFGATETMAGPIPVLKIDAFQSCMRSTWAEEWQEGVEDVTIGESSDIEEIVTKANGCQGMVNSDSMFVTQLIYGETNKRSNCVGCRVAKRLMSLAHNGEE